MRWQNVRMNERLTPEDMLKLPITDRLRLIEELWNSLDAEHVALPVPDWHKAELDKRLAAHEADPSVARPWDEVKADILANLDK